MLCFGNVLKEAVVTERLAVTARTAIIDIAIILLGVTVGASTQGDVFLTSKSVGIFVLGAVSFCIATACGVLFAKFMNLFLKSKINPLLGAAGVSAVPDSARVVQIVGQQEDPSNFLLMHAMAPNVSGVIGSAIAAGFSGASWPRRSKPVLIGKLSFRARPAMDICRVPEGSAIPNG
jgi:oxaloacetate decarboxylase beta subunit